MKLDNLEIRSIRKSDSPKAFLDFICELIDEKAYLQIDEKPTLKWEREWLKKTNKEIKNRESIRFCAWEGKKLVAMVQAKRGLWNERDNICIGISVLKAYRGKGLGEKLLRMIIKLAKTKLKPKNIFLSVVIINKPAFSLYKKVGFKTFARFPKWAKRDNKYIDVLYMLLKK
ncbi:MAG: GNAT family N-acetyltransferase [Candidatus Micrarchaeota archaeon]|nr:GNAT family N-acetyltransferase [Candidatus Micrarchaeota archaeon]